MAAGADINAQDAMSFTALLTAISNDYTELAKMLIEAGANLDLKNIGE